MSGRHVVAQLGTVRDVADLDLAPGERPLIFSYGAGVDSYFALVELLTSELPTWSAARRRLVAIVHADLGAELPETTWHLEHVAQPFAAAHGWSITVIRPRVWSGRGERHVETFRDYIEVQGYIPSRTANRWCADKFKITPIADWSVAQLGLGERDVDMLIGFEANEALRVARLAPSWRPYRFLPLVELGWTREAMVADLERRGLVVPIKSRCSFCPFSNRAELRAIAEQHPEIFARDVETERRALAIATPERAARGKPAFHFFDRPLAAIGERFEAERAQLGMFDLVAA